MFDPLDTRAEQTVQAEVTKFLNGQVNFYTFLQTINIINSESGIIPQLLIQAATQADQASSQAPQDALLRGRTTMLAALARDAQYGLAEYNWLRGLGIRNTMPETFETMKAGMDLGVAS
jgi:hypothetical protein